jgi:hypothetical protein
MGDSGDRKERIKIPLIGWEGTAGEKDARAGGSIASEIPDIERVKFPGLFLMGRLADLRNDSGRPTQDHVLGNFQPLLRDSTFRARLEKLQKNSLNEGHD